VGPRAKWEESLEEAAEPGRTLALRLRLPQSLDRGHRAVRAALDALLFHRVSRFVPADAAGMRARAVPVQRGGAAQTAAARDGWDGPLPGRASRQFDHGQTTMRDTPSLGSDTMRPNAGPKPDTIDGRGIFVAQAASPPTGRPDVARNSQQTAGYVANRVKLHWHSGPGQPAVERRTARTMAAGLSAGATPPSAVTRERAGPPDGEGRNPHPWTRLPGAALGAGGGRQHAGRHFQRAITQAANAQTRTSPGDHGAEPRPPAQPLTKAMAPIGLANRPMTVTPAPSVSPLPDPAGRSGAGTGSQGAGIWPGETGNSGTGSGTGERQGPTQGDVYLDGRLMGRWMAQSLAAEAGRPASGSAGFDPRRNVFPTGAMIGG
jgi:hypothetical protein